MLETTDPSLLSRIHRILGVISYSLGDVGEAEVHAREAVRLAEQGDDPRALGMALAELAHCGGGGLRDDLFSRAIALDGSAGPMAPRTHRAKITMDAGHLEAARSQLEQLLREATFRGDLRAVASHHLYLAELELWLGNWRPAMEHADKSLLLHEYTDQPNAPRYAKAMSQACLGQVDLARLLSPTSASRPRRTLIPSLAMGHRCSARWGRFLVRPSTPSLMADFRRAPTITGSRTSFPISPTRSSTS